MQVEEQRRAGQWQRAAAAEGADVFGNLAMWHPSIVQGHGHGWMSPEAPYYASDPRLQAVSTRSPLVLHVATDHSHACTSLQCDETYIHYRVKQVRRAFNAPLLRFRRCRVARSHVPEWIQVTTLHSKQLHITLHQEHRISHSSIFTCPHSRSYIKRRFTRRLCITTHTHTPTPTFHFPLSTFHASH